MIRSVLHRRIIVSFRSTFSLKSALVTLSILVCLGTSDYAFPNALAQEAASVASGDTPPSLEDQIDLAEIRLAIRLQAVEFAKAERRILAPGPDGVFEMLIKDAEQKTLDAENEAFRLNEFRGRGGVTEREVQNAGGKALEAMFERENLKGILATTDDKLAAQDAKIELWELRVKLAKAKLNQLKRQLKR